MSQSSRQLGPSGRSEVQGQAAPACLPSGACQGRSRIRTALLAGLVVFALSAAGCSSDSDEPADRGDTAPEAETADTEAGSGAAAVAPDREPAIAAIAETMTVMPSGPGIFFSPGEARCLAERIIDEVDPALWADIAADPGLEQSASQPEIDSNAFVPDCVDSLARFEELMTAGTDAETAACMTEAAGTELAYAIAVGPFFGEDISPEHQAEQADLFEICNTLGSG